MRIRLEVMRGIRIEATHRGELSSALLGRIPRSFLSPGKDHPSPVERRDPTRLVHCGTPRHNPMFEHLFEHVNPLVHSPRDH
jgi:hypothetical protein